MCGIVGVFTTLPGGLSHNDTKAVRDLTIANTVRGDDGTGVFYYLESKKDATKVWYLKDAVAGPALFDSANPASMLRGSRFAVVHNRAATTGCLTSASTHPFVCENVVGVHNGTVQRISSCLPEADPKITVDSHAIFDALSKAEAEVEATADVLARLESGAYALVWIDHRAQQLRMARNTARPLHLATTASAVWFASELPMLEWILDRNKITAVKSWSLKPHHLVCIPVGGGAAEVTDYTDKLPKVTSAEFKDYGYGYRQQWTRGASFYDEDDDDYTPSYLHTTKNAPPPRSRDVLGRVTLGTPPTFQEDTLKSMYEAGRKFIGADQWLLQGQYGDLAHVFAQDPRRYAGEFYPDTETGKLIVPVYIRAAQEDRLLSYIIGPCKDLVPVAIGGYLAKHTEDKIRSLIKQGKMVEASGLEMTGIRFYHYGDMVLRMGQTQYHVGVEVRSIEADTLPEPDDTPHPEEAAYMSTVDWAAGWGTVAVST